jgi:hypothetical protein
MSSETPSAREYLAKAAESVGQAWAAWKVVDTLRRKAGDATDDPVARAQYWMMDGLVNSLAGFVRALDEASAAKQLIEYENTHKLFEPVIIRRELLLAGQFLTAFEMLMGSVVGQLRASFYTDATPGEQRLLKEEEYQRTVLSLNKGPLKASCLWLRQQGVLDEDDLRMIDVLRRKRNDVAHKLPALLFTKTWYISIDSFRTLAAIVSKVDMWWLARNDTRQPRSWAMVILEYMLESVTDLELGVESPLRPAQDPTSAADAAPSAGTKPKD